MIFGTAAPKFISGSTTVLLDYARIITDKPVYNSIEQPSVLTGFVNHIHKGYWWLYTVRIHLFKESEAITKANELLSYIGQDVYLYKHREANAFQDSSGNDVLFRVQEVVPSWLNTPDYKDIIDITFKSQNYIDLTTLPTNILLDSDGRVIVDSDGNYITG